MLFDIINWMSDEELEQGSETAQSQMGKTGRKIGRFDGKFLVALGKSLVSFVTIGFLVAANVIALLILFEEIFIIYKIVLLL